VLLHRILGEFVLVLARHRDGAFCLPEELEVRTRGLDVRVVGAITKRSGG